MNAWVLILVFYGSPLDRTTSMAATSASFETQELCESAGKAALALRPDVWGHWLCTPARVFMEVAPDGHPTLHPAPPPPLSHD